MVSFHVRRPIQFANPFLVCVRCGAQVIGVSGLRNLPCGHRGDYQNRCLSWSPVDGCSCVESFGWAVHT